MKALKTMVSMGLALCLLAGCGSAAVDKPEETTKDIALVRQEQLCAFSAQYIRTDGYQASASYPAIKIIHSREELQSYYEENKDLYDLERREEVASDSTIGFLDACDKYDSAYFEDSFLILILLEEGSGSIRHTVDQLSLNENGELTASISTTIPEVGISDMALWHIIIEPGQGITAPRDNQVTVLVNGVEDYQDVQSQFASDTITDASITEKLNPVLQIKGEEYALSDDDNKALEEMLMDLPYSPAKVCKCLPEFTIVTESGSFDIHLNEGYSRCERGQADLTDEQIQTIREIMEAAQNP